MANPLSLLKVILPGRSNPKGVATTSTFNPSGAANVLSAPAYREHLTDLFSNRTALDSRSLLQDLFKTDPDMSAAVHAFLTVADTQPLFVVKTPDGQLDPAGQALLEPLLTFLTTRTDYSKGFKITKSLSLLTEELRYMLLLRGAIGAELVVSKEFMPAEIRQVDMSTVRWYEKTPGAYTPEQAGQAGVYISLDIPSFFAAWFRQDPTAIYSYSPFVSSINTIAARQQVINDLYRIMQLTGFPRMEITILEEVALKSAPPDVQMDPAKKATYLQQVLSMVTGQVAGLRPDQTFVHFDSVTPNMMNEKSAANTLDISSVINTLNAQNQAGLRTMATILGRGESGVNTATVEARVFSMSAQALNVPIADLLSQMFTLGLRLQGSQSIVEVSFAPVELRSELELEAQLLIRANRLRQDLSDGIITDEYYHLTMYRRLPPPGYTPLSGTKFMDQGAMGVDVTNISPNNNNDPLGKSAASREGQKAARNNNAGKAKLK